MDGAPLETPRSYGGNVGMLAGFVAAALALGGAAWYVRRRRDRLPRE